MHLSLNFPSSGGLPRVAARSASASLFSRPAQRSLHVTACMLAKSPEVTLYTRGFSSFVTSTTAPIATGFHERVRVKTGMSLTDDVQASIRTHLSSANADAHRGT